MRRGESGATMRKCRWNTRLSFVAEQPRGDWVRMSIAIVREIELVPRRVGDGRGTKGGRNR